MDEKVNLGLESLRFIYNKNKQYIIPVVIILISVLLFIKLVIPQFENYLKTVKEAKEMKEKTALMKDNLKAFSSMDKKLLDSQTGILTQALPREKDFIGILNTINYVSQKTGVRLGKFSMIIGDVSSISKDVSDFSGIDITVPVEGNIIQVSSFIEIIGSTFPLADITSIKKSEMSTTVGIFFYYKPITTKDFELGSEIKPISKKGLTLIKQLKDMQETVSSYTAIIESFNNVSSSSAIVTEEIEEVAENTEETEEVKIPEEISSPSASLQ